MTSTPTLVPSSIESRADEEQHSREKHRELYEARARWTFPDHARDRLFFQQLDAWTHPVHVKLLRDPSFVSELSDAARARFVTPLLGAFPLQYPAELFRFAASLFDVVRTRAELLLEGRDERPDLDLNGGIWAPWSDGEGALCAIVSYLRKIVELHFTAVASDGRAHLDLEALRDAFCRFASGRLAFVDAAMVQANPMEVHLNAEPDSAYFFCWAEIALQAADRAPAGDRFWLELATLFVALEDVYLISYGGVLPKRELVRYAHESRRIDPKLTLEAMRAHLSRFEAFVDSIAMRALARRHAANVLFAGRDEFIRASPPGGSTRTYGRRSRDAPPPRHPSRPS